MSFRGLVCLVLLSALAAVAEDWPRFLGPRGDNTSAETGLIEKLPASGPPVVWEREIGTGYSAPSVLGTRLVLHHRQGNEEVVQSLDAVTGQPGWRHAYPSQFQDPYGYNNGPRCTPLLTTNRCFTFGAEGRLVCLELEAGRLVWQRETANELEIPPAFFGVGSTPLLEGDRLIVMVGGQPNSGVVALDPATGKTLWQNVGQTNWHGVPMHGWPGERTYRWTGVEKSASYASPFAVTIHGQRHLLCVMRQGLVSLNPTNGAVNFTRWFQSVGNDSVNAMTPIVQEDLILISGAYFRVGSVLLRVRPDGKSYDEVWRSPRDYQERDADGRPVQPVLEMHWSKPNVVDGFLYAFSGRDEPDATFRCLELKTGKVMWTRDERAPKRAHTELNVFARGSTILAEGRLYALGEGGLLGIFTPSPKECLEVSRWQVPSLHYPCWAAPVLSNRRLYLRSEDRLVCLDLSRR
jgi:outer membrane protein assembly factor BamB